MSEQEVKKRSVRYFLTRASIVILFFLSLYFIFIVHRGPFMPIREVFIQGNISQAEQASAQNMIKPLLLNGFLGVDLDKIQSTLQQLPGINIAEVHRIWPDKLSIFLSNQTVVAIWNNDSFLNRYGEKFSGINLDKKNQLPQLSGPENSEIAVLSVYQQVGELLQPMNLAVQAVNLTEDGLWSIKLSNSMQIQLGQRNLLAKLQQLMLVYPTLTKNGRSPKSVDLRYKHGMAVIW